MSSGFAAAFYRSDPRAQVFLPTRFVSVSDWPKVDSRGARIHPTLLDEIDAQQQRFGMSRARQAQLKRLREGRARVVVTGQQVGLFLGPLYTLYKALTAIEWARRLEQNLSEPVVPVFWLQSEDHDFDEIAHTHAVDENDSLQRIEVPVAKSDARVSVAHRSFGVGINEAVDSLRVLLRGLPRGDFEAARFARHYRPGSTPVQAFAGVLAEVFEDLIVFDPRCETVARLAAPIHRRAVYESAAIGEELDAHSRSIENAGFSPQVRIRPESTLSFFHLDSMQGPRFRLVPGPRGFELGGGADVVSNDTIDRALAQAPLRFSTSALLRPVVQDTLFPTAAYVAGPGEISYFAQLKPLYDRFELDMPMVVPRRHFSVIEPETRRALNGLDLGVTHLSAADLDEVAERQVSIGEEEIEQALMTPFGQALSALEPSLTSVDQNLQRCLDRTQSSVERAVGRLASRARRAQLRRSDIVSRRLGLVRNHLFPAGSLQERVLGAPRYFARFGVETFIDALRGCEQGSAGAQCVVEPPAAPTGGRL